MELSLPTRKRVEVGTALAFGTTLFLQGVSFVLLGRPWFGLLWVLLSPVLPVAFVWRHRSDAGELQHPFVRRYRSVAASVLFPATVGLLVLEVVFLGIVTGVVSI